MNRARRRTVFARFFALTCLAMLGVLVGGCAAGGPAWGERTGHLNRVYYLDGRDDRCIVYRDSQAAESPLTLLFVHGLASSKGTWQFVAPEFERDCRVILIDLLGHGDSSKPARHEYSMSAQGDIVRKFILDKNLQDVVIVGCSYGGGTTLEAVLPLFRSDQARRIRGLVLIGAAALDFPPPPAYAMVRCPFLRVLGLVFTTPEGLARELLRTVFWRDNAIPDELLREYTRVYRQPGAILAGVHGGLEIFDELRARRREANRYAAIDCPVLLIWGDHDSVVPPEVMDELAEMLPQARKWIIPDCGHTPQEEQPEQTAAALRRFLHSLLADVQPPVQ